MADQSDSMESHSTDDVQLSSNLPAEQPETKTASVSDAALQDGERKARPGTPHRSPFSDLKHFFSLSASFLFPSAVETLRQLILRDLEEEGWSHDSDDTPTNEAAGERGPPSERPPPSETVLKIAEECEPEEDAEHEDAEQQGFQVVRKGRNKRPGNDSNLKPFTKIAA